MIYDHDYVPGRVMIGDADLSGDISIPDATEIQRSLASLVTLDETAEKAADADLSGDITILDATAVQRWLAALVDGSNRRVGEAL